MREGDDREHATNRSSDGTLYGLQTGRIYGHLFEDVRIDRRGPTCHEAVTTVG